MNVIDIHTLRKRFVDKLLGVVTIITLDINNAHYDVGYLNARVLNAHLIDAYEFKVITKEEYMAFLESEGALETAFREGKYENMVEAHDDFLGLVEDFGTDYVDTLRDKISHIIKSV